MNLEVCVRKGTQMVLHPDQVKQWNNSGVEYAEQFAEVQKKHDSKYLGLLTSIISQPQGSSSQLAAAAPADMDEGATAGSGATEEPIQELNKFESVEKLAEAEKIEYRCMSEVAGIELLLCESKKIFLVADKDRIVAKWTMVGGFGTGKQFGLKSKFCHCFVFKSKMGTLLKEESKENSQGCNFHTGPPKECRQYGCLWICSLMFSSPRRGMLPSMSLLGLESPLNGRKVIGHWFK